MWIYLGLVARYVVEMMVVGNVQYQVIVTAVARHFRCTSGVHACVNNVRIISLTCTVYTVHCTLYTLTI